MGPSRYLELIEKLLNSSEFIDEPPHFHTPIEIFGNSFFWKDKITFRNNHVLKVTDATTFTPKGDMLERSFSYDFRDAGIDALVFRIDNHNRPQPVSEPCHVHAGSDAVRIECFPTSGNREFSYVMHCIKNYYLGKQQDWDCIGGSTL